MKSASLSRGRQKGQRTVLTVRLGAIHPALVADEKEIA